MSDTQNLDVIGVVIFLGLVQGLFLSILFLVKKDFVTKVTGILLLMISIQIFDIYFAYTLISLNYPHLLDISVPLGLFVGPLMYLLFRNVLNIESPKNFWIHWIPGSIYTVNQTFYFIQSADFKFNSFAISRKLDLPLREATILISSDPLGIRYQAGFFIVISLVIYAGLIVFESKRFSNNRNESFWNSNQPSFQWFKKFIIIYFLMTIYSLMNLLVLGDNPNSEYLLAILLTVVIYFVSYETLRHSRVLISTRTTTKYEKSTIPDELKESLKSRLISHMENDKAFLNNMFSLKQLSQNLSISSNHLSQILNQDFNQNYHEFVAIYRIKEAQKILHDPKFRNKNIEEISTMVGYNSKAAFNKAFKRHTGETPLEFKKKAQA